MRDFTVWVSYGKWRKNWDIRYCLLHLIHLNSTRLRKCGRILSGICKPFCLITPDLTMHYCPTLILIDYRTLRLRGSRTRWIWSGPFWFCRRPKQSHGVCRLFCDGSMDQTRDRRCRSTVCLHSDRYRHSNLWRFCWHRGKHTSGSSSLWFCRANLHMHPPKGLGIIRPPNLGGFRHGLSKQGFHAW